MVSNDMILIRDKTYVKNANNTNATSCASLNDSTSLISDKSSYISLDKSLSAYQPYLTDGNRVISMTHVLTTRLWISILLDCSSSSRKLLMN